MEQTNIKKLTRETPETVRLVLRLANKVFNIEIELGEQEGVYKTREEKEINMGYNSEITAKIKI